MNYDIIDDFIINQNCGLVKKANPAAMAIAMGVLFATQIGGSVVDYFNKESETLAACKNIIEASNSYLQNYSKDLGQYKDQFVEYLSHIKSLNDSLNEAKTTTEKSEVAKVILESQDKIRSASSSILIILHDAKNAGGKALDIIGGITGLSALHMTDSTKLIANIERLNQLIDKNAYNLQKMIDEVKSKNQSTGTGTETSEDPDTAKLESLSRISW